ncbi:hypothetical protein KY290_010723 [Solanum tuberosum]|uniref:Calpain catalytic domain-containing protein n=1 Tax=Solanum tuberosum TaxID=4113 RepID=A0ABQ7VYL5_SOLTU|nr:hypothetical protein KY290_010723 [Solanum tuberosum]
MCVLGWFYFILLECISSLLIRKALLEKQEQKWKEIEVSLISPIPNAGNREASATVVVVRAVGGDSALDDSFARERVSSIARCIHAAQLSCRALQLLWSSPNLDLFVCLALSSRRIFAGNFLQGIEAGQVGLRLITKTDKQTTVKEWSISATSIADGRWHIIILTIDADLGEYFDGYQTELPLRVASCIWELGTDVWGGCLTKDEIAALPAAMGSAEYSMIDLPYDNWQWEDSPTRIFVPLYCGYSSDPTDVDLYDKDDVVGMDNIQVGGREGQIVMRLCWTWILLLEVEIAMKEALLARGESHFTDQEFPPNDWTIGSTLLIGGRDVYWFLSVVDVLTEVSRISEVIITPEYNQEGIYTVRFCIQVRFRIYEFIEMNCVVTRTIDYGGKTLGSAAVREVDGHKLVLIRNPLANEVEWNGPWYDPSHEWTDGMKHKLKHVPQVELSFPFVAQPIVRPYYLKPTLPNFLLCTIPHCWSCLMCKSSSKMQIISYCIVK